MSLLIPITIALSAVIQLLAAVVALSRLSLAGSFRTAWICVSLALFLMLQRRLVSLWYVYAGEQEDLVNSFLGLAVSVFMLIGLLGLKRLFIQMHKHANELQNLANTDFLTGLKNRRYFREQVEHELLRAQRNKSQFSLLMIDIDFFKRINDNYGHHIGDIVLQEVAHHCEQAVRKADFVGRFGGEEFVIFLPESTFENALEVADRLRKNIEKTILAEVGNEKIQITVSIGLVNTNQAKHSVDKLLDIADKALYEAKTNGRNRVCSNRLGKLNNLKSSL